jgi:hypothetical protein
MPTDPPNYGESPLITVQLMFHEGDKHLVPRCYESILNQGFESRNLQLQMVYDGSIPQEDVKDLKDLVSDCPHAVSVIESGRKFGYYCAPRNQALPHAWGHYIAHIDADNEWKPGHLYGLLQAIRTPGESGIPHFTYSRREYVTDYEPEEDQRLPLGPSPLYEWTKENIEALASSPMKNFIDTGDFLIGRSALYELAERTRTVWDSTKRRFGDWDLVRRLATANIRGKAVDQVTHIYHWTGDNIQLNRPGDEDLVVIPLGKYEDLKRQGKVK